MAPALNEWEPHGIVVAFVFSELSLFARGAMAARQVLTLKIEVRVLAGEPLFCSLHRALSSASSSALSWCSLEEAVG